MRPARRAGRGGEGRGRVTREAQAQAQQARRRDFLLDYWSRCSRADCRMVREAESTYSYG